MPQLLPLKIQSSNLLSILFIYAKNLELEDSELTHTGGDQNILTCRAENIQKIWGERLGQILTSEFDINAYKQLLLSLVRISLTDSVTQNIKNTVNAYFPQAQVDVYEYWKDPSKLYGYDWQNKSFMFRGAGDTQIPGNNWNDTRPWVDNLRILGFFLFGVQIHLRNLTADDVAQIESYVIPALETFVRPAGVYYKTIVLDIMMDALDREKVGDGNRLIEHIFNIVGFGLLPFGSPYNYLPVNLSPAIAGYWKLNDNAANTDVIDSSVNNYTGVFSANTNANSVAGKVNTALSFTGSQVVSYGNIFNSEMGTNDFSIAYWVKLDADGTGSSIGSKCDGDNTFTAGWQLRLFSGRLRLEIIGTGGYNLEMAGPALPTEVWTFVAMVFDRSESKVKMYLNASEISVSNSAGSLDIVGDISNTGVFKMGFIPFKGPLKGQLDNIQVFNRVITPEEISFLYNSGDGTEEIQESTIPVESDRGFGSPTTLPSDDYL